MQASNKFAQLDQYSDEDMDTPPTPRHVPTMAATEEVIPEPEVNDTSEPDANEWETIKPESRSDGGLEDAVEMLRNEEPEEEVHPLETSWVLWGHLLNDRKWDAGSYHQIYEFNSVEKFWKLYSNLDKNVISKRYLFLMRQGIMPMWEDPANRNGGSCSIKVYQDQAYNMWLDLSMYLIGETLLSEEEMDDINGLSISRKSNCYTIKIWNSDSSNDISAKLPEEFHKKYHKCSIRYQANKPEY